MGEQLVKCVDCGCRTLPRNAAGERPWSGAATLQVSGRANEGALCFACAEKRRAMLGLPVEQGAADARASAPGPKTIRINGRECTWDVDSLAAVLARWREQQSYDMYKDMDLRWALVMLNDRPIAAASLAAVPICDGDHISLVLGRGRYR